MANLPTQIMDYSVYNSSKKIIGTGDEITLPSIVSKTTSITTPAGDMDIPSMMTENMDFEIPFNVLDEEAAGLISMTAPTTLTLRGALQYSKTDTHDFEYKPVKIEIKGYAKEIELGKFKRGDKMDSKVKLGLTYIKITVNDKVMCEIDKLNGTFIVNNVNLREEINKHL